MATTRMANVGRRCKLKIRNIRKHECMRELGVRRRHTLKSGDIETEEEDDHEDRRSEV